MVTYHLDSFLSGHVFGFLLLLSRFGAVMMLFPGIGEAYVPPRTRMMFAFMICLLLLEPMMGRLPALPSAPAELLRMVSYEIIVGLFFGTLIRLLVSTLESTGMIIGLQTGLSNATLINPALATQSPLPSAFLSIIGLVLVFNTGLDHFIIRAMIGLYNIFPAGGTLMPGDMTQTVIHITNQSFVIGIELAAPFLIMGLLFYTTLGIMQRLLPTVQLFLISIPVQIYGGLLVLSLTLSTILTLWLQYIDESIGSFFQK
jgi:flagellar biosynthetic protein FliR